jgi:L-ribulose-5-phosphate 3-epimerase
MRLTRRDFLQLGAASAVAGAFTPHARLLARAAKKGARFKVGVTDWNLRQTVKPEAIQMAKRLGFDGVQVSIGRNGLPLKDPALQRTYLALAKEQGLPVASLCLDILHVNGLKSDPLGQRWVAESIPIAQAMGVKVILLPFFGRWQIRRQAEQDYVGDALREVAPLAEKAGVILGLEDTSTARENVRVMERSKSPAVLTYYDVGNSTLQGYDVIKEIRWLGRERICEVHLKDNPHYMGKGTIDFPGVVDALADIGFAEWAHLETDSPSGSVEGDMAINLKFIRDLVAKRNAQG